MKGLLAYCLPRSPGRWLWAATVVCALGWGLAVAWWVTPLTLHLAARSDTPRTIQLTAGAVKRGLPLGEYRLNKDSHKAPYLIPLGRKAPRRIHATSTIKSDPMVVESLYITNRLGLRLGALPQPESPKKPSKTRETYEMQAPRGRLYIIQSGLVIGATVLGGISLAWLFTLLAWAWRNLLNLGTWTIKGCAAGGRGSWLALTRALHRLAEWEKPVWTQALARWRSIRPLSWRGILLLIFPVLLVCEGLQLASVRGPIWLQFRDPEYAYFFNSLNIVRGNPPEHIDHPGTPLQLLGALVIWSADPAVASEGASLASAIGAAETHLHHLLALLLALCALTNLGLGLVTWVSTRSLGLALVGQLGTFLAPVTAAFLFRPTPEILLIIFGKSLAGVLLLASSLKHGRRSLVLAALAGIICGAGVVTKIVFVPLVLCLAFFQRWRAWAAVAIGLAGSMLVITIPIWPKLAKMFTWISNVSTHTGFYGHGEKGVVNFAEHTDTYIAIFWNEAPYLLTYVACGVLTLVLLARSLRRRKWPPARLLALFLLVAASFGVLVLCLKHPRGHYLMPAMATAGVMLVLTLSLVAGARRKTGAHGVIIATILLGIGCSMVFSGFEVAGLVTRARNEAEKQKALCDSYLANEQKTAGRMAYSMQGLTQESALCFGRFWADPYLIDEEYTQALSMLYPHSLWAGKRDPLYLNPNWPFEESRFKPLDGLPILLRTQPIPGQNVEELFRKNGHEGIRVFSSKMEEVIAVDQPRERPSPSGG